MEIFGDQLSTKSKQTKKYNNMTVFDKFIDIWEGCY